MIIKKNYIPKQLELNWSEDYLQDAKNKKALVVFSGGLDSTILLHWAQKNFKEIEAISFDFKQKFKINNDPNKIMFQNNIVELLYARDTAKKLNIKHHVIEVDFMEKILQSMRNDSERFNGNIINHQPKTCMPFRNMILLATALSVSELNNVDYILTGYQTQDQHGYWDTSQKFIDLINNISNLNPNNKTQVIAPFVDLNKSDEILIGQELNVDFANTWTCYNPLLKKKALNEDQHIDKYYCCGKCPACLDRLLNFEKLGLKDPQIYWDEK